MFCVLTTTISRAKIYRQLNAFDTAPEALVAVSSKMVVLLLLNHYLLLLSLMMAVLYLVLFCYLILSVLSSFAIISLREREREREIYFF